MRDGIAAFRKWILEPHAWLKNKLVVYAGAGVAFVLASLIALGPIARSRAAKTAERYGMTVEIGRVWPAFGGVKLKNVRFRIGEPEWISGDLETVDVGVGLTFGLRSLSVRGGRVSIAGHTAWQYLVKGTHDGARQASWPAERALLNDLVTAYGSHLVLEDHGLGPDDTVCRTPGQPRQTASTWYCYLAGLHDSPVAYGWQFTLNGGSMAAAADAGVSNQNERPVWVFLVLLKSLAASARLAACGRVAELGERAVWRIPVLVERAHGSLHDGDRAGVPRAVINKINSRHRIAGVAGLRVVCVKVSKAVWESQDRHAGSITLDVDGI